VAVTLGLFVAVVQFVLTEGAWARWDSAGLQGPVPEWLKLAFTLLSFPIVLINFRLFHGSVSVWIRGHHIDLFMLAEIVNSALWGATAAVLYLRFSKRLHSALPIE
jgi:hypothetical protein